MNFKETDASLLATLHEYSATDAQEVVRYRQQALIDQLAKEVTIPGYSHLDLMPPKLSGPTKRLTMITIGNNVVIRPSLIKLTQPKIVRLEEVPHEWVEQQVQPYLPIAWMKMYGIVVKYSNSAAYRESVPTPLNFTLSGYGYIFPGSLNNRETPKSSMKLILEWDSNALNQLENIKSKYRDSKHKARF